MKNTTGFKFVTYFYRTITYHFKDIPKASDDFKNKQISILYKVMSFDMYKYVYSESLLIYLTEINSIH